MRLALYLIPEAVLARREQVSRRRIVVGVPLIAVLVLIGLYALLLTQEMLAKDAATALEAQLVPLRPAAARLGRLENETDEMTARQQQLQTALGRPRQLSGLLQDLGRLIPDGVWLQSLRVEGDAVNLTGRALDIRSVAQFVVTLRESRWLEGIQVRGIQQAAVGAQQVTQFEMTARLRRGAP